jgi:hypothetical protein
MAKYTVYGYYPSNRGGSETVVEAQNADLAAEQAIVWSQRRPLHVIAVVPGEKDKDGRFYLLPLRPEDLTAVRCTLCGKDAKKCLSQWVNNCWIGDCCWSKVVKHVETNTTQPNPPAEQEAATEERTWRSRQWIAPGMEVIYIPSGETHWVTGASRVKYRWFIAQGHGIPIGADIEELLATDPAIRKAARQDWLMNPKEPIE